MIDVKATLGEAKSAWKWLQCILMSSWLVFEQAAPT